MKRILILGGGISKERDVSLETAKQVNICLKKKFKTIIRHEMIDCDGRRLELLRIHAK